MDRIDYDIGLIDLDRMETPARDHLGAVFAK